jgi:DNA-binding response OmpR family regulator
MSREAEIIEAAGSAFESVEGFKQIPVIAPETVLFVEDEQFVRGIATDVLRFAGYRVLVARDAVEALRSYEGQLGEVDLLVTDVVLPGESGHALALKLRREHPRLKILLISGYAEQMLNVAIGSEECLAKPFTVDGLLRKVRQVLDASNSSLKEIPKLTHVCGNA